jgi:O-acetylhomoserine (thiol)-lyase
MNSQHPQTSFIHKGASSDAQSGATHTPIYQSAGFSYESMQALEDVFQGKTYGHFYSRNTNPTIESLEKRLTAMDSGLGAVVVSSGMAAITTTVLALAKAGDHIIVGKSLFGASYYLFKDYINNCGIQVSFVDPTSIDEFKAAITSKTKLFFVESIGNPKLDVPNLKELASLATAHNAVLVVDSTFTTPYLLPAKKLGVHVVLYSTTKYVAGGGSTIGGAIVDTGLTDWKEFSSTQIQSLKDYGKLAFLASVRKVRSNAGSCQSPFNAFLTSLGIDTLVLRMKAHCENALKLAQYLETHNKVENVNYPGLQAHKQHSVAKTQFETGFGGMLTLRLGSKERVFKFIDTLKLAKTLVNLGDAKTLVVYPATTIYRNLTNQQREEAGVYDDLVRVSVGLEHSEDIVADFSNALEELK